jgi:hypothetical protein
MYHAQNVSHESNMLIQLFGRLQHCVRTIAARQHQRAQLAAQLHNLQLAEAFPPSVLRSPVYHTVRRGRDVSYRFQDD